MKKKDIENLIYGELNAEKPDENVLNAAKMQMANISQPQNAGCEAAACQKAASGGAIAKRPLTKKIAAVSLCAVFAVAIIICLCLPNLLRSNQIISDDEFTTQNITSIRSYDSNILSLDCQIDSSTLYLTSQNEPVYIMETYADGSAKITLYVLLDDTQTVTVLSKFDDLAYIEIYGETTVSYGICGGEYAAKFTFGGYGYYLRADVSQADILNYASQLLNS